MALVIYRSMQHLDHLFRLVILLAFLLKCVPATGQAGATRLNGKITDAISGLPVPYASLSVLHSREGTNSNADGEFELRVSSLPIRLIINDMGHVRDTVNVAVATQALQIRLQPATVTLPEVKLGSYTAELLKKAARRLRQTNGPKTYAQAFYRQLTRLNDEPTEVQEMIWHARLDNAGMDGTAMNQGRFAKKKALISFNDFSKFTRDYRILVAAPDSGTSLSVLGNKAADNFTLSLLGVTTNGAQELVEIGFVPKNEAIQERGSVVIDANSYHIMRLRVQLPINLNMGKSVVRAKAATLNVEGEFEPTEQGTRLKLIKTSLAAVLTQPLKADSRVQVEALTAFYDARPAPAAGVVYARQVKGLTDLESIKAVAYDPAFWQQNSAVKRTPLEENIIKSFEQKRAFGTMLTP